MGARSRRTGAREEHNLTRRLPGAEKISRTGHSGPDLMWRNRFVESKYRTDNFATLYKWLDDDASILAIRRPRHDWLIVTPVDVLLDLLDEAAEQGGELLNEAGIDT